LLVYVVRIKRFRELQCHAERSLAVRCVARHAERKIGDLAERILHNGNFGNHYILLYHCSRSLLCMEF
jgi:hypothetical protein